MPRGLLEVVLDTPGGKVRAMTTHLEYYSPVQRMAQVHQLRTLHAEACARSHLPPPDPGLDAPLQLGFRPGTAILCGDFNFAPDSPDYSALLAPPPDGALAFVDAWNASHPDQPRAPTTGLHGFAWPERAECYDYMFVTEDLAPRIAIVDVRSETPASDHQPVVLELS
jgi:endonuclease/exonuclease/phosphatase family metal-dependent hydrolase